MNNNIQDGSLGENHGDNNHKNKTQFLKNRYVVSVLSVLAIVVIFAFQNCGTPFEAVEQSKLVAATNCDAEGSECASVIEYNIPVTIYNKSGSEIDDEFKENLLSDLDEISDLIQKNSNMLLQFTFSISDTKDFTSEDDVSDENISEIFPGDHKTPSVAVIYDSNEYNGDYLTKDGLMVLYNRPSLTAGAKGLLQVLSYLFEQSGNKMLSSAKFSEHSSYSCIFTEDAKSVGNIRNENVLTYSSSCDGSLLNYCNLASTLEIGLSGCSAGEIVNPLNKAPQPITKNNYFTATTGDPDTSTITLTWMRIPFAKTYNSKRDTKDLGEIKEENLTSTKIDITDSMKADEETSDYESELQISWADTGVGNSEATVTYNIKACNTIGCSEKAEKDGKEPSTNKEPTITEINPLSGKLEGDVYIVGTNFNSSTSATFTKDGETNGVAVDSVDIKSGELIHVTVPASLADGKYKISVDNGNGTATYEYFEVTSDPATTYPQLEISEISPSTASADTSVTISLKINTGYDLTKVTIDSVRFGSKSVTDGDITTTIENDVLKFTVTAPEPEDSNSNSSVDVKVWCMYDGDVAGVSRLAEGTFTYQPKKPEITGLSPSYGPTNSEDTKITIEGKNFQSTDSSSSLQVFFGDTSGTPATCDELTTKDDTDSIKCSVPKSETDGQKVNVVVKVNSQESAASEYTYYEVPTITVKNADEVEGRIDKEKSFTIEGKNFLDGNNIITVSIKKSPKELISVENCDRDSSTKITCTAPDLIEKGLFTSISSSGVEVTVVVNIAELGSSEKAVTYYPDSVPTTTTTSPEGSIGLASTDPASVSSGLKHNIRIDGTYFDQIGDAGTTVEMTFGTTDLGTTESSCELKEDVDKSKTETTKTLYINCKEVNFEEIAEGTIDVKFSDSTKYGSASVQMTVSGDSGKAITFTSISPNPAISGEKQTITINGDYFSKLGVKVGKKVPPILFGKKEEKDCKLKSKDKGNGIIICKKVNFKDITSDVIVKFKSSKYESASFTLSVKTDTSTTTPSTISFTKINPDSVSSGAKHDIWIYGENFSKIKNGKEGDKVPSILFGSSATDKCKLDKYKDSSDGKKKLRIFCNNADFSSISAGTIDVKFSDSDTYGSASVQMTVLEDSGKAITFTDISPNSVESGKKKDITIRGDNFKKLKLKKGDAVPTILFGEIKHKKCILKDENSTSGRIVCENVNFKDITSDMSVKFENSGKYGDASITLKVTAASEETISFTKINPDSVSSGAKHDITIYGENFSKIKNGKVGSEIKIIFGDSEKHKCKLDKYEDNSDGKKKLRIFCNNVDFSSIEAGEIKVAFSNSTEYGSAAIGLIVSEDSGKAITFTDISPNSIKSGKKSQDITIRGDNFNKLKLKEGDKVKIRFTSGGTTITKSCKLKDENKSNGKIVCDDVSFKDITSDVSVTFEKSKYGDTSIVLKVEDSTASTSTTTTTTSSATTTTSTAATTTTTIASSEKLATFKEVSPSSFESGKKQDINVKGTYFNKLKLKKGAKIKLLFGSHEHECVLKSENKTNGKIHCEKVNFKDITSAVSVKFKKSEYGDTSITLNVK